MGTLPRRKLHPSNSPSTTHIKDSQMYSLTEPTTPAKKTSTSSFPQHTSITSLRRLTNRIMRKLETHPRNDDIDGNAPMDLGSPTGNDTTHANVLPRRRPTNHLEPLQRLRRKHNESGLATVVLTPHSSQRSWEQIPTQINSGNHATSHQDSPQFLHDQHRLTHAATPSKILHATHLRARPHTQTLHNLITI